MQDINIAFSRELLKQVRVSVRAALMAQDDFTSDPGHSSARATRALKDVWVWKAGRDHWEFHGPNKFYWHGRACNAYEARAKGWQAWLQNPKGTH